ncbi:hypothetical protein C7M84_018172 [Penaeus vannamei]|uniref:Uncharacterized protein n=1 Tax=Penaeus vannamei TaxID=6689 RepID=A0A3R7M0E6_PENVA|nr:hypothetical protein C7M84_018172 [Penaeus vannamei]
MCQGRNGLAFSFIFGAALLTIGYSSTHNPRQQPPFMPLFLSPESASSAHSTALAGTFVINILLTLPLFNYGNRTILRALEVRLRPSENKHALLPVRSSLTCPVAAPPLRTKSITLRSLCLLDFLILPGALREPSPEGHRAAKGPNAPLSGSDMDMCCSEWDDDDDLATTSSNYVTLNRPISRRRILESSQTQCDSEDSGIEYQSNEDDPALEDRSSAEDHSCEDPMQGHEEGVLATGTSAKHVFEDRVAQPAKGNQTTTPKFAPTEALENDKVVIVETTPPVPTRRPAQHEGALDPAEEELQLKRAAYTIRNKEVRLAELPKPDTVRSVKGQLFEEAASPCSTPRLEGPRFDSTIKSNSASKILASTGARATPAGEVTASATDPNPAEAAQPRGAGPAKVHPAHSHLAPTSCWLSCGGTKESQKGLAAPQPRPARRPQHVVAPHALRGAQEARGARLQRQEGPARGPQELPPPQHESKKERRRRPAPARARRRRRHSTRTREKAHTTGTHVGGERGGGLRPCDTNTRKCLL